ncbi:TPA: hypothetical protein EYP44_03650 [Candidatus Bathyarchaeota archaeon]|nr:hypothetical protein [Candidatus Bathyarchaeota archaeon]
MTQPRRLDRVLGLELEGIPPYSFDLSVHKPAGWAWISPFEAFSEGTVWTGFNVAERPIGIKAWSTGTVSEPSVRAEVYSDGPLPDREESLVETRLAMCLGLREDVAGFYELAERHDFLRQAKHDLYGMRCTPFPDVFTGAILAVTLQWSALKRSVGMRRSLYLEFGDRISFDGRTVILCPSPRRIASVGVEELRGRCNLGYRASFIRRIAEAIVRGDAPAMDELYAMPPSEARRRLRALKGIGEYSADIISPRMGFPVDVWSARIFARVFGLDASRPVGRLIADTRRVADDLFGEWKGYVFVYVINDLAIREPSLLGMG